MSSIILLHSRTLSKINKRTKVQGNDNPSDSTRGAIVKAVMIKILKNGRQLMGTCLSTKIEIYK